jgi:hypothetical protein
MSRTTKKTTITVIKDTYEFYLDDLCVTPKFILNYAHEGKKVYLWQIGKVIEIQDLCRDSLCVDKNPQQFAYCPLSYGESY